VLACNTLEKKVQKILVKRKLQKTRNKNMDKNCGWNRKKRIIGNEKSELVRKSDF